MTKRGLMTMTDIRIRDYDAGVLKAAAEKTGESIDQIVEWLIEDGIRDLVPGFEYPLLTSRKVLEDVKTEIEKQRYGLVNDGLDLAIRIIDKFIV